MEYLLAALVVGAVNLLPAFGPPTWAVLIVLQINLGLDPLLLVPIGACAATTGRVLLARGARHFRGRISEHRRDGLDRVAQALTRTKTRGYAALGLFLLSPIPSAQLFIAAGLLDAPLRPLAAAFLAGRLVSYSLYVGLATVAASTLSELLGDSLTSPLGIALQLLFVAGLVALVSIDWTKVLAPSEDARARSAGVRG